MDKDYFWDKENDPALPGLLQSIHTLTGHVIVEGIETEKQKRLITSAGDIIGQGRYWKEEYIFLLRLRVDRGLVSVTCYSFIFQF